MNRAERRKPLQADLVEVFGEEDYEQGSAAWFDLRLALCTASNFKVMMALGKDGDEAKTRARLLDRMVAEHFTKKPANTYENDQMRRGKTMERAALDHYEFTRGVTVERVGFVRRTIQRGVLPSLVIGCSPDGLVGKDRVVQIKTMDPELIIGMVRRGTFPSEHRAQCQGELWVTGRQVCDLKIFYDGCPVGRTFPIMRDDAYIETQIRPAVERFDYDMRQIIADIEKKGLQ